MAEEEIQATNGFDRIGVENKIDEKQIFGDERTPLTSYPEKFKVDEKEAHKVALYENFTETNRIDPEHYRNKNVKRGLRNADGTGVLAGVTRIADVHGYKIIDGEKVPDEGSLRFRGYELADLIGPTSSEYRFNFEEVIYLLLMGKLPTRNALDNFIDYISDQRDLPNGFIAQTIMEGASKQLMNVMSRSILSLYVYDKRAEERTPTHEVHTALSLISKLPRIMILSYYAKQWMFNNGSMVIHPFIEGQSTAETILSMLRLDRSFTPEEARMLDVMLCIHAEHGGGNNSTFTARVLSSADTDPYSAYSAAIGSLKGFRHGGANHKIRAMQAEMEEAIPQDKWDDEGAVADYLRKIVRKEAYDRTGLIYGMGHAVYTISDPRAVILKKHASKLAEGTEFEPEYRMLEVIERVSPMVFAEAKGKKPEDLKPLCANVDMYSGFVYNMLGIPKDIYTPLFACARMAGWSAHRFEEIVSGKRIIRPAYENIDEDMEYSPIEKR